MSQSYLPEEPKSQVYAGVWRRLGAALIDATLLSMVYCFTISLPYGGVSTGEDVLSLASWAYPVAFFETIFVLSLGHYVDYVVREFYLPSSPASTWAWYLAFPTLNWLYHALMESSPKQATLGKMALKIQVTDGQGNRVSILRASARHFSKIVSTIIVFIGFLMVDWTKKKQALHDKIAGCLVVRNRVS